jgi:hypothetical protein
LGESFDVIVASPRLLAVRSWEPGGILDARHHVIVDPGTFDQRWLLEWVPASDTWSRGGYLAGCGHDRGATWQA